MAYKFTLIFDSHDKSITPEKGLSIRELGEYISSLAIAIELDDIKCSLSQIKKSSYALVFTSGDRRAHDNFVNLMENLETKDIHKLPQSQRDFGNKVKEGVNSGKFFLRSKDNLDKEFARISQILIELIPKHFFETTDITGKIIQVGSRSEEKSHIVVSTRNGTLITVNVNSSQDFELAKFYKTNDNINFIIRTKRDFETNEIEQANLVSFSVPQDLKLHEAISQINREFGDLFPNIEDSIKTLSELRNQN